VEMKGSFLNQVLWRRGGGGCLHCDCSVVVRCIMGLCLHTKLHNFRAATRLGSYTIQ